MPYEVEAVSCYGGLRMMLGLISTAVAATGSDAFDRTYFASELDEHQADSTVGCTSANYEPAVR